MVSDKKIYHVIFITLSKLCDPWNYACWSQGHILIKCDNSLRDDAMYQISRLLYLLVSDKIVFSYTVYYYVKHVALDKGHKLLLGA